MRGDSKSSFVGLGAAGEVLDLEGGTANQRAALARLETKRQDCEEFKGKDKSSRTPNPYSVTKHFVPRLGQLERCAKIETKITRLKGDWQNESCINVDSRTATASFEEAVFIPVQAVHPSSQLHQSPMVS